MDLKKDFLDVAKKHIDLKGMAADIIVGIGHEALTEAVKKTATPIDDLVVAALAPQLEKALLDAINKKVDELFA